MTDGLMFGDERSERWMKATNGRWVAAETKTSSDGALL